MKKKIVSAALTLALILALLPAGALAAGSNTVTVIKTDIKADRVVNTEGYGSLTIDEVYDFDQNIEIPPKYALINEDGNFVFDYGRFPCTFNLYDGIFANGIYQADGLGVYSLFDLSGKQVISQTYDYLSYFNGYGLAVTYAQQSDTFDTQVLIDQTGKTVLEMPAGFNLPIAAGGGPFTFETFTPEVSFFGRVGGYGDDLLWVSTASGVQQHISEAQNITSDSQVYQDNSYQMAAYGGPYAGYIDMSGNVVIPIQYFSAGPFCSGLARVQEYVAPSVPIDELPYGADLGGDWFYIDKTGTKAFASTFSEASNFSDDGYAYVANDAGKYGYIDTNGQVIIPLTYDDAFGDGQGLFTVGQTSGGQVQYGIVDKNNQVVVPLEYDDITPFENDVAYAIKDGFVYLLKLQEDAPSDWAVTEVTAAIDAGLVPESLQSNYTGNVTRGQVAEMFIRLVEECAGMDIQGFLQQQGVTIDPNVFSDTSDEFVLAANALGIINGVGEGRFSPDGTFTRAQIAVIINRTADVLGVETAGFSHDFVDMAGHWADSELGWPVHAGVINGVGEGRFNPDGPLTTEQAIVIAYRALQAL